jgi:4'-phosphopantetheinyl transferase
MEDRVENAASAENSVTVFYTRVSPLTSDQLGSLVKRLIPEESLRASRFVFARDRELYIAAHMLLRFCLFSAGCDPQQKFQVGEYGKPELHPPHGDAPVRFNLSHTNGLAACALSRGHAVGIDVEEINRRLNFEAVTKMAFASEELDLLSATVPSARPEVFFRLWTLKEAIIKGIGRGLSLSMRDFVFELDPLSLKIAANIDEDDADWQVHELVPTADHRLALAVKRTAKTNPVVTSEEISVARLLEWSKDPDAGVKQASDTPSTSR